MEEQLAISPSSGFKNNLNQLSITLAIETYEGRKCPKAWYLQLEVNSYPEKLFGLKKIFLDFDFHRI
jgi:hypothetical protein